MSIAYSGTFKRSAGVISAITKQLKSLNLKSCKKITITFDPFAENIKSTREFLFLLSTPKVIATNPRCIVKTDIVCDRQPAEVKFSLIDSAKEQSKLKEIRFISDNLDTLEILQLYNKHITPLAPPEEIVKTIATKSSKQKLASSAASKKRK